MYDKTQIAPASATLRAWLDERIERPEILWRANAAVALTAFFNLIDPQSEYQMYWLTDKINAAVYAVEAGEWEESTHQLTLARTALNQFETKRLGSQ